MFGMSLSFVASAVSAILQNSIYNLTSRKFTLFIMYSYRFTVPDTEAGKA